MNDEPIFKHCNVCGRELVGQDELNIGACETCLSEEEEPINAKEIVSLLEGLYSLDKSIEQRAKKLRKIEARWRECGKEECAAIYQGAAFELEHFVQEKIRELLLLAVLQSGEKL